MEHMWLFEPIKWVLIGLLIFWVLTEIFDDNDRY